MRRFASIITGVALVAAAIALAVAGQLFAPPNLAPVGGDTRQQCDVEAPEPLHAAAKRWCDDGLFLKAIVTAADAQNVVAVMQFTPNGAQAWQLQSGLLMGEFRTLTDRLADAAGGRNVSVALNDPGDRRVGVCERKSTDAATTCAPAR
jgi:hypothetical protein